MEVAQREGITKVAHGVLGDAQLQLELAYYALNPLVQVVVPWRDAVFLRRFPSPAALECFEREHDLPTYRSFRNKVF